MPFAFSIPGPQAQTDVSVEAGESVIFVGANGVGKTRLTVRIEDSFVGQAHRISAHRALSLNPEVAKMAEKQALLGLRIGRPNEDTKVNQRAGHRWQSKAATALLNDFDFIIQALFADQANKSLQTHQRARAGDHSAAPPSQSLSI